MTHKQQQMFVSDGKPVTLCETAALFVNNERHWSRSRLCLVFILARNLANINNLSCVMVLRNKAITDVVFDIDVECCVALSQLK